MIQLLIKNINHFIYINKMIDEQDDQNIKNSFDNNLISTLTNMPINLLNNSSEENHTTINKSNPIPITRTRKFYNNQYLDTGKILATSSTIYRNLCKEFIKEPKHQDTVSYIHKDGTIHKGIILDNQKILVTCDSKLEDTIFNNTIDWINALDEYLPVRLKIL